MIECRCGERDCTTVLDVKESAGCVDIKISYECATSANEQSIELDPNGIVQLIKQLKTALINIA